MTDEALRQEIERPKEFVRYEMVRISDKDGTRPRRYRVYGYRENGLMVEVDTLYLHDVSREVDAEIERLTAKVRELTEINSELCSSHNALLADGAKWQSRAESAEATLIQANAAVERNLDARSQLHARLMEAEAQLTALDGALKAKAEGLRIVSAPAAAGRPE